MAITGLAATSTCRIFSAMPNTCVSRACITSIARHIGTTAKYVIASIRGIPTETSITSTSQAIIQTTTANTVGNRITAAAITKIRISMTGLA